MSRIQSNTSKGKKIESGLDDVVFIPTLLAYAWIIVQWRKAGVTLYLFALWVAFKSGYFNDWDTWPTLSKWALYIGVPYIALGLYFSFIPTAYSMMIPFFVYMALCITGGRALRRNRDGVDQEPSID